ncbi:Thioredoxin-like fold protein [Niveomyces insectorum RCEF 264]|uniref:Thioredoxin-like fold protein n=1 Tax=Niveomyces insectorum RCEF 264 TaxID=1081102 RepID=A0A167TAA2_9HYPO|nr:Thioredoxin-like fold protein [Niveomyces insectorum RCEF 264]
MFSSLTTKLAMRKIGISNDTFNFTLPDLGFGGTGNAAAGPTTLPGSPDAHKKNKSKTRSVPGPPGTVPGLEDEEEDDDNTAGHRRNSDGKAWPAWMTVRALPLTVQPWLTPPPAPIPVAAACPRKGDAAPEDRDRKLTVGGGKPVLVVFLRCVGCAFAQKTFLALRTLANRHAGQLRCVAVSHASFPATHKWIDLLGGAWNVQVLIDEDRAVYAAWGLGLGSVWTVLNPGTQIQAWKETGWLGQSVAQYMRGRHEQVGGGDSKNDPYAVAHSAGGSGVVDAVPEGPATLLGNKWQQAGAFAVNGRGTVIWGCKAERADDVLDLDQAVASLGL